ncbi:MAG TPA: hypothetical protein VJ456_07760 [Acidimicrobiia bacterium]|nr:hypothetical protein [Acidimicrobiia bacterium]HTC81598.1 hypothetical protein [Acidimicrobiia bacterium]
MVLIVLIVLWSIVLVPPAWQSHVEARRARQVDAFRRKLAVLAPAPDTPLARRPIDAARPFEAARAHVAVVAGPNVVRLPVTEAEEVEYDTGQLSVAAATASARRARRARARVDVLRRRQQVLVVLMVATVASLAGAFALSDVRAWALHGLVVTAFAAYLAALRRLKRLVMERRAKVRYFPAQAPAPASSASGASSASSAAVR